MSQNDFAIPQYVNFASVIIRQCSRTWWPTWSSAWLGSTSTCGAAPRAPGMTIGTCAFRERGRLPGDLSLFALPSVLDPTFSYNCKRKLLASGTIKVEVLNATPTGNLPEADVAKFMDTYRQAMRTTWLENGQRNHPHPRTSYHCHNPATLLLAFRGQESGGLFLSLTSDPESWCALKGECARSLPSFEGKALPTLMPPRSGSRSRPAVQWADRAGLSYTTLGWMTGDEALCSPPQVCGVESSFGVPAPACISLSWRGGPLGSKESRPWSHTTWAAES